MGDFRRIEVSQWESNGRSVSVIEVLEDKLAGAAVMQELARELATVLERTEFKDVVLSLARVEFIASAALNRLINFHKRVHDAGGRLKLCSLQPTIEKVFIATRLNQVFDIRTNEADALSSF